MNIETANRLLQYRKNSRLSQEELAEKIGVSRQAVSKWERAEASPDTDNLIMLAKVYGVTLDELLNSKASEIEPLSADAETHEEKSNPKVSFLGGIHVDDGEGNNVNISFKEGVHVDTNEGAHVHIGNGKVKVIDPQNPAPKTKFTAKDFFLFIPFPIIICIAFFLWGFSGELGGWTTSWLSFLTIPLYYSLVDAIVKRNASHFAFPVLTVLAYLIMGFFFNLWHPGWIVFLLIPVYYVIVDGINRLLGKGKPEVIIEDITNHE